MDQRPWHRLFGLSWADFCEGSALEVRPETDLSVRQQFVDLVLVRQGGGPLPQPLPDGFDDLATHNLVTFKSHQEALDGWALCELVGHYVNHRKQSSPSLKDLLPEADFRLYAVCVRYPHNLAQVVPLTSVQEGVYEVPALGRRIRIVVVQQLPQADRNALLHLFSTRVEQVQYARQHYHPRTSEMTTLFYELLRMHSEEPIMSELLKAYVRERLPHLIKTIPIDQLLSALSPEQRVEGLSPEQRIEGLSPEQRVEGLSPEQRVEGLSPEQRLEGLSPDELRAIAEAAQRRLQKNTPPQNL